MSLRNRFLVVLLISLLLPWLAWQLLQQTAGGLRETQQASLLAQARSMAASLALQSIEPWPDGASLPVLRSVTPIRVDGYADDWQALRDVDHADATPRVTLADDGISLFLLAEVRDATRQRADPRDSSLSTVDYFELALSLRGEQRRYRIASAGPGRFDAKADSPASRLPDNLSGEWQEDGSGYRIELRLPRSLLAGRIGWQEHDGGKAKAAAAEPTRWRSVIGPRPASERALQAMSAAGLRVRLLSVDAVLLADSGGRNGIPVTPRQTPAAWLTVLDRLLMWGIPYSSPFAESAQRLDSPLLWQALSGIPAVAWHLSSNRGPTLSVVVPIRLHGDPIAALLVDQSDTGINAAQRRALGAALMVGLLALLVTAISLTFAAILLLRIRHLHNSVAGIGARDDLRDEHTATASDELGDIARRHARLVDEMATWTDYLRSLTSRLSHELNTPLAIVKSSLDNLDQSLDVYSARGYLARARDGADRLGAIIRAMSESNRIERTIAGAEAEDFDLGQLVAGCAEGYRALVPDRVVEAEIPTTPVHCHGAPELMAQALDKLFDNARSFTPVDGWISFALSTEANEGNEPLLSIRVANQGPALPTAMQDRLFDTLVSVRERSTRATGEVPHLGLGLYVVKLVAELHRGSASAHNLPSHDGVEFELRVRGMERQRLSGLVNGANRSAIDPVKT